MNAFNLVFNEYLPGIFGALLLLIIGLVVAWALRRMVLSLLKSVHFDKKLIEWGIAHGEAESENFLDTIGSLAYFIGIIFFLPGILSGLNIGGIMNPLVNMVNSFVSYIPNIIFAIIIIVLGIYFCQFIRILIRNLLMSINIDKAYSKLVGVDYATHNNRYQLADVIATIVYVLIFIPILTVALKSLNIPAISDPIVNILNQIISVIPKIITALVLVIIGAYVTRLIGGLVENLTATIGLNRYSKYLNFKAKESDIEISEVIGFIVRCVLMIFFVVEAISVLELDVFNNIGKAVLAYLPLVLSAIAILGFALISANVLAGFIGKATGNWIFAEVIRYVILIIGSFMILEQLQIAQTIVNTGFIIILGSIGLALALALGLGARDFVSRQLDRADQALHQDKKTEESEETKA